MSPLAIEIMLHYYVTAATDYGCDKGGGMCPSNAPAVISTINDLLGQKLLDAVMHEVGSKALWAITERGTAYVKFLCDMPLPINRWVMPS